jgi:hypothetical protein
VARIGKERKMNKFSVGKHEEKRPLERPRRRWEDSIRIDLMKISGENGECIHLVQNRDRWRALAPLS